MKKSWWTRVTSTSFLLIMVLVVPSSVQFAFADVHTWTNMTSLPMGQYQGAATSGDGTVILASARSNFIQRSTNSGSTWARTTGTQSGTYLFAMSIDGSKIFAGGKEGGFNYTSTDSGASWTARTPGVSPHGRPCMSDDGLAIMVTPWGSNPRQSVDGGASWSNSPGLPSNFYSGCAFSSDGSIRYAILASGGTLYRSVDAGANWSTTTLPQLTLADLATSSDGSIIFITSPNTDTIYKSTNFGQTFTLVSSTPSLTEPRFIALSGDGTRVVIFDQNSLIKVSLNGGSTWTSESSPGLKNWFAGDISDDGSKIVAPVATNDNYVYKSGLIPPTSLTLSSGSNAQLIYRINNSINVTTNFAGRVTFFANGKRIGGCVSIPTVSLVATCNYKPSVKGGAIITARSVPTNQINAAITVELFRTKIAPRQTLR